MRMLDIDIHDVGKLTKMTEKEAYQFLKDGVHIVCQVSPREFHEVFNVSELDCLVRLETMGIYKALEYYEL